MPEKDLFPKGWPAIRVCLSPTPDLHLVRPRFVSELLVVVEQTTARGRLDRERGNSVRPSCIPWDFRIKPIPLQMTPECIHIRNVEDDSAPPWHDMTVFEVKDHRP